MFRITSDHSIRWACLVFEPAITVQPIRSIIYGSNGDHALNKIKMIYVQLMRWGGRTAIIKLSVFQSDVSTIT